MLKNQILELADSGLSYQEIANKVFCNPAYVWQVLGPTKKEKKVKKRLPENLLKKLKNAYKQKIKGEKSCKVFDEVFAEIFEFYGIKKQKNWNEFWDDFDRLHPNWRGFDIKQKLSYNLTEGYQSVPLKHE